MKDDFSLKFSLFLLRASVFLVMFMWTLDKFIRPEHAAAVYEQFYFMPSFGHFVFYIVGIVEIIILIGFLIGLYKTWTYGLIFLFHFISSIASIPNYLAPFEGVNLLFYAGLPMLAACFALFILRERDRFLVIPKKT